MAQVTVILEASFDFDGTSGSSASFTIAAGDGLLVLIGMEVTGKAVSSVTWDLDAGAESLAKPSAVALFDPTHGKEALEVWWLSNPTAGTDTLTVNVSESQKAGVVVLTVTDFDTDTPFSSRDTDENSSGTSGAITATQDADDLGSCIGAYFGTPGNFTSADTENKVVELVVQGTFEIGVFTEDGPAVGWSHGGSGVEVATLGFTIETAAASGDDLSTKHIDLNGDGMLMVKGG